MLALNRYCITFVPTIEVTFHFISYADKVGGYVTPEENHFEWDNLFAWQVKPALDCLKGEAVNVKIYVSEENRLLTLDEIADFIKAKEAPLHDYLVTADCLVDWCLGSYIIKAHDDDEAWDIGYGKVSKSKVLDSGTVDTYRIITMDEAHKRNLSRYSSKRVEELGYYVYVDHSTETELLPPEKFVVEKPREWHKFDTKSASFKRELCYVLDEMQLTYMFESRPGDYKFQIYCNENERIRLENWFECRKKGEK